MLEGYRGTKRKRHEIQHNEHNLDHGVKISREAISSTGSEILKPSDRPTRKTNKPSNESSHISPISNNSKARNEPRHDSDYPTANDTLARIKVAGLAKSSPLTSNLPIAAHRDEIITALQKTDVLILSGETGSGKSTQLPQYLLSSLTSPVLSTGRLGKKSMSCGKIAVTQPRRVAAISLARRVSQELHCPLGKAAKAKVGYAVRFDRNVGMSNRIIYLTEGMLMMDILRDPGLCEYGVVVVDEVHERSVDVDLLLGFMRDLITGIGKGSEIRKKKGLDGLKVVVMSATADVEALVRFFEGGYEKKEQGLEVGNEEARKNERNVSNILVKGRQYPVQVIYQTTPVQDFVEAGLKTIFHVHCKEPMPGDILVFLTGQEVIQALQRNIEEYAQSLGPEYPRILVLPIYAALPQAAQQRVFDPAPPNTRKVILATNIAETSITVPGVRFVIDSGKEKRKQFRPRLGLESLLVKSISMSSATQRTGRAGREAAGKCWRLYTEKDYGLLEPITLPEIMRCDLADAVLKMKANGVEDVLSFPFLSPPSKETMARSLLQLYQLGAINDSGHINELGRKMSRFPLSPVYGRVILSAADDEKQCVLPVIDIISCFSADNTVFLNTDTEELREEAAQARQALIRRRGDHLTLLAAVQSYASDNSDRKAWADRYKINHRAMQSIMDIRKQLRAQCQQLKMLTVEQITDYDDKSSSSSISELIEIDILKCFLSGFKQNIARLMPDGSYRTFFGNQTVAIHPSSVLFGKKVEAVVYNEFVFTNKTYARGVSAIQVDWVEETLGV